MEGIKRWREDVSRIPDYTEAMFDLFIFFFTISWEGEDKIRLAALPYFPRRYAYFQIYLRVRVQSERGERKKKHPCFRNEHGFLCVVGCCSSLYSCVCEREG